MTKPLQSTVQLLGSGPFQEIQVTDLAGRSVIRESFGKGMKGPGDGIEQTKPVILRVSIF